MPSRSSRRGGAASSSLKVAEQKEWYALSGLGLDAWMALESNREQSFLSAWPFGPADPEAKCTPQAMAASGFYRVGGDIEVDLVRCFYCRRELSGWERSDVPNEEHARKPCDFMALEKSSDQLTRDEIRALEGFRIKCIMNVHAKVDEAEGERLAKEAREELETLIDAEKKPKRQRNRKGRNKAR